MKAVLGQRQLQWVNDMWRKYFSWERLAVVLVILISFVLIALLYSSNDYMFGDEVRWARLSYSLDREQWNQEIPYHDDFWIKGELDVPDVEAVYNALFFGLNGSYDIYWDGKWLGRSGGPKGRGKIHYIQPLDVNGVHPGYHSVELKVHSKRWLFSGDLFVGIILGNANRFAMQPVLQFSSVAVTLGLLLMIGLSIFIKGGKKETLWLIVALMLYLVINYLKTLYNYPYQWHEFRLLAYGFVTLLLALAVINYAFSQSLVAKYKVQTLLVLVIVFSSYFYFADSYHDARFYLLLTSPVLGFVLISSRFREVRSWFLMLLMLIATYVVWEFEIGLLMILVYVAAVLLEYFSDQEEVVEVNEEVSHLVANHRGEKKLIPLMDIAAIKGANNYTEIILDNQEHYLCDKSLGKILEEMPLNFIRIHKSYIVDFNKVSGLKSNESGGKLLQMKNGLELPVGRTYVPTVKERLL